MFENTKLPLTKWFLAIYLLTQTKKGASGMDLKRKLGVNKDTAWGMRQKILAVMKSREDEQMLYNQVQIDDVYYGGKLEGKSGRGSENKQAFLAYEHSKTFMNNENKEVQKKNFKKFNAINTLISNLKNFLRGTHHDVP